MTAKRAKDVAPTTVREADVSGDVGVEQTEPTATSMRAERRVDWGRVYRSAAWRFFGVIVVALGALAYPLRGSAFFSVTEAENIVRNQSTIVVMAVMTVFVIAAGEIDLSFAAVVPVAAYTAALVIPGGHVVLGILAALGVGVAVGLFNGIIMTLWRLPSFIVTLGTMSILNGAAIWVTNSQPVSISDSAFSSIFGNQRLGPIQSPLLWVVGITVLGYLFLSWTPAGKKVLATGANRIVAQACGIRTARVQVGVMVASGVGGAIAGLLYGGLLGAAQYNLGSTDLLTVLAAAIIGGTSLAGGKGSVIGATIAALLLGTLESALILLGLGVPQQTAFEGGVVVLAVILGGGRRLPIAQSFGAIRFRWRESRLGGAPAGRGDSTGSLSKP